MPVDTRQRLIEAAVCRFYRDGFRNVGLDQILADVAISKTAFYKHFPSKEDLMLAALESQNVWLQQTFRSMVLSRAGVAVADQLRSLLDVVEMIIESDQFHGCIFVNVAMEFPSPHDPAHRAAAENKAAIEQLVCDIARQGEVPDPQGLARELCMIFEGAYVTRQTTGNPQTVGIARRLAERVLAGYLPRSAFPPDRPPETVPIPSCSNDVESA